MKSKLTKITLLIFLFIPIASRVLAQNPGMKVGPNYVVWEAEATDSPLGKWEIIKPGDSRYNDEGSVPPIGETHLEFTGNNHNSGPATSPLEYTFTCPKSGTYRLGGRMLQRLEGQPHDKCNDVYIKMSGNFTSGNGNVSTEDLKHDQKFYGRGVDKWGAIYNLEVHSTGKHAAAIYNLIAGEKYTLTVSGRAQRTNIDYWLLYETSLPITLKAHNDLAAVNDEEYRPAVANTCKSFEAKYMQHKEIDGFANARIASIAEMDILEVTEHLSWAAAKMVYEGTNGKATFSINTLQENEGESTYRLKINNTEIGEVTNNRIHGTSIPENTIQTHKFNETGVDLNDGDTIQIEFNNAKNGLVINGDDTLTSNGRWLNIEICTFGHFAKHGLSLNKEIINLPTSDSVQLQATSYLPFNANDTITWTSKNPEIATVNDSTGLVKSGTEGETWIIVRTNDGRFSDSCKVIVKDPVAFSGSPATIPGVIEAEDFDIGGEGSTYHDLTTENQGEKYRPQDGVDIETCTEGGFNVAYIKEGEWLTYTINIEETENYYLLARVASTYLGGKFHIEIDGEDVTGTISFSSTRGWQIWETIKLEDLNLTSGQHKLTLVAESSDWNLNWLRLLVTGRTVEPLGISIDKSSVSIEEGSETTLTAEITPDYTTEKTINWTSLNPEIAKVNSNGVVLGVAPGNTTIKAETYGGSYSATCALIVTGNSSTLRSKLNENVEVYPNPFKSNFTIDLGASSETQRIVLRNSSGQVVYATDNIRNNQVQVILNKKPHYKGLYLLELHSANNVEVVKLISE